jgi:hypothetical protein
VYLVPDLILDYPELFSGERVGVHECVHSWEEVSLGRRGVEGAEERGLGVNEQGEQGDWMSRLKRWERGGLGGGLGERWTDGEIVADPVGDLGEHVG